MKGISQETGDKEYYRLFDKLNNLHSNFYDEFIPIESFPIVYEKALYLLDKINKKLESMQKNSTSD